MFETRATPSLALDDWLDCLRQGIFTYCLTSLVVFLGVLFGWRFLPNAASASGKVSSILDTVHRFDVGHYRNICVSGYSYDPTTRSSVAFFPLFPLAARGLCSATGWEPDVSLLIVSNGFLVGACVLFLAYARIRNGNRFQMKEGTGSDPSASQAEIGLLFLCLTPTTFFFRLGYSESTFLFFSILSLLLIELKCSPLIISIAAGFCTAARPVGIALVPPLLLYVWRRSPTRLTFLWTACLIGLLSCWGLFAFMAYQYVSFQNPFAFMQTQIHWEMRPSEPWPAKILTLISLQPVWDVFNPTSPCYWMRDESDIAIFNMLFVNALSFLLALVVFIVGLFKRSLTAYESLVLFFCLLTPYVTKGYENNMFSMARFVAVAFPIYFVLADLCRSTRPSFLGSVLAVFGFMLGAYAALFAAGHYFF